MLRVRSLMGSPVAPKIPGLRVLVGSFGEVAYEHGILLPAGAETIGGLYMGRRA